MSEEIIQIWDDKAHTKKVYPVTTTEAIISPSGKSVADDVREQVEDGMADLSAIKSSAQVATAQAREATTRANRAADSATIAANNPPYINVQTKTWMVFSNGSYVDSGICAEGQTEVTKDNIVRALGYQPAKDAAVMHNTGNEEINGEKVFNDDCTFDGNQTKFGGDLVTDTDFYQHGHIDQADGAFAKITALSSKIGNLQTGKQDKLTSGANIKTINGTSVLGSGNIVIPKGDKGDKGDKGAAGTSFTGAVPMYDETGDALDATMTQHAISAEIYDVAGVDKTVSFGNELLTKTGIIKSDGTFNGNYTWPRTDYIPIPAFTKSIHMTQLMTNKNVGYALALYDSSQAFLRGFYVTTYSPDNSLTLQGEDLADAQYIVCSCYSGTTAFSIDFNVFSEGRVGVLEHRADALESEVATIIKSREILPLGVFDNIAKPWLQSAGVLNNLLAEGGIGNGFLLKEGGQLVGLQLDRFAYIKTASAPQLALDAATVVLKVKKSANTARTLAIVYNDGVKTYITDSAVASVGQEFKQVGATNPVTVAKVGAVADDYYTLWIPVRGRKIVTIISYTDSAMTQKERLVLDSDMCAGFWGEIAFDEIDYEYAYRSRAEKLGSRVAGKNIIVFADSLQPFSYALAYDYGMNVTLMGVGGTTMGYLGAESTWIQNDARVQTFNAAAPESVDFILNCQGQNGVLTESNAAEVEYVLTHKRWYFDTSSTDPWASLSASDKLRFTSSACIYAMFFSMCRHYIGAACAISDIYRTLGSGRTAATWDAATFANYLFTGENAEKREVLKGMAAKLGAIWIENKNRDSVAAANAYHPMDGVHPPQQIATDWAANIAETLGIFHDKHGE